MAVDYWALAVRTSEDQPLGEVASDPWICLMTLETMG